MGWRFGFAYAEHPMLLVQAVRPSLSIFIVDQVSVFQPSAGKSRQRSL